MQALTIFWQGERERAGERSTKTCLVLRGHSNCVRHRGGKHGYNQREGCCLAGERAVQIYDILQDTYVLDYNMWFLCIT